VKLLLTTLAVGVAIGLILRRPVPAAVVQAGI